MNDVLSTSFEIATAPRRNSKHWKDGRTTWGEVLSWLPNPRDKKECGNYIFGKLGPCACSAEKCNCSARSCDHLTRGKTSILRRRVLTHDLDRPDRGFSTNFFKTINWASALHTTYSSSPDAERFRTWILLSRDVNAEEYYQLSRVVMRMVGEKQYDPGSSQPERYMFRPAAQHRDWYSYEIGTGEPLPVDELLEQYDPADFPQDVPKPHHSKRSPFDLQGAVGAFNRAYDLDEVIAAYELPYEKISDDRYHLVGASSQAGMGPVAEGLYYSHHVSDPAGGQTCSAFDLVRLHRFGDLDNGVPDTIPVNRRPSHEAMLDLAGIDPRVTAELVGVDFDSDLDDSVASDWRLNLRMNARTGQLQDIVQNWDLIRKNEPVFRNLHFNEMTLAVEIDDDLPWRPVGRGGVTFSATDRAELSMHIEREYGLRTSRQMIDDLVATAAAQQYRNPLRERLESLEWDGVPRLEECLPGVVPTPYTRLVARKVMTAAVARVMSPGIKWDHTLVLFGAEGLGKSHWIERMGMGYSATLGRIGDKDTLIAMQRSWIMVSDEGYSLKKADSDVQKEFLTRTDDIFRMPYDREAQAHKRRCVIWGTTNDQVFLRRQEGNRRFLIVQCTERVDFDILTEDYVDQVWAEAMTLYRAGERLFLTDRESKLATSERELFIEEDALVGLIQEYLDTPVPDDWESMSPEARVLWRQSLADGMVPRGEGSIDRVCSTQIWVEALGKRVGDARRTDLLEINAALKRTPGWVALPSRHRLPFYGPQLVFVRDEEGIL